MIPRQGFGREQVRTHGAKMPALQRIDQRRLVHQAAMRGVDQDSTGPHQPQGRGIDQPLRLRRQRQMQGDDVARLHQLPERDERGRRLGLGTPAPAEQPRPHGPEHRRQPRGHRPVADQTHRAPADLAKKGLFLGRERPARRRQAAQAGEHQGERHLGHGLGVGAGGMAHGDAARLDGREIDPVEGGAELLDQAQPRRLGEQGGSGRLQDVPEDESVGEGLAQAAAVVGSNHPDLEPVAGQSRHLGGERAAGRVGEDHRLLHGDRAW
jgi:hypothetical protein